MRKWCSDAHNESAEERYPFVLNQVLDQQICAKGIEAQDQQEKQFLGIVGGHYILQDEHQQRMRK